MTTAWDNGVAALTLEIPKVKIKRYSDSKFWGFLKENILAGAAGTTVGYTIYLANEYFGNDRGAEALKHERIHVLDYQKWGILFYLSYFFLLPVVFTMRAYWEWRGYKEDLKAVHEQYKDWWDKKYYDYITDYYCQWVAGQFSGPGYLFMFPFKTYMYKKCQEYIKSLQ